MTTRSLDRRGSLRYSLVCVYEITINWQSDWIKAVDYQNLLESPNSFGVLQERGEY